MPNTKNSLVLVLHTHLPYVLNHGFEPHGEAWLYEAAAECYIPLLNLVNELEKDQIKAKITFDISPVLCEQLASEQFKIGFVTYCEKKIKEAENDKAEFAKQENNEHFEYLADFWKKWYSDRLDDFLTRYSKNIIGQFKILQDKDLIEVMTCGVTHGYMPLLGTDSSVELQVEGAVANYEKHFGKKPTGIWLPECAYRPAYNWRTYFPIPELEKAHPRYGEEHFLNKYGINYFISDEKFIREMRPLGKYNEFDKKDFVALDSPEFKPEPWNFHNDPMNIYQVSSENHIDEGVAAVFARHKDLSMLVWSGKTGYPGEGDYLDFHKQSHPSRLRYWRITDTDFDIGLKEPYHPDWIADKIDKQTHHYIHNIENAVNFYKNQTNKNAVITLAFDTELFGHWWFEGPEFLKSFIKGLSDSPWLVMQTCEQVYQERQIREVVAINEGSWGKNNSHEVWINEDNKWTWEELYRAELRFGKILKEYPPSTLKKMQRRVLNQALREMLLFQSSDWQFLIETGQARDYAEHRFHSHLNDFNKLCDVAERLLQANKWQLLKVEKTLLVDCESRNMVFPEITLEMWH